jgi:hypothetical protein
MNDNDCFYCKSTEKELRPYGPSGATVCFDCAMSTPERALEAEENFTAQLNAAGLISIIGEETGPRPLDKSHAN